MRRRFLGPLAAGLLFAIGCPVDPPVCDGDTTDCGGTCTSLLADSANCGACGVACAPGSACANGACAATCAEGLVSCGGACVDPLTDPAHCGAEEGCSGGEACGPDAVCRGGACVGCQPNGGSCLAGPDCCSGYCGDGGHCQFACFAGLTAAPTQVPADGFHGASIRVTSGTTPVVVTATRGAFVGGTQSVTFTEVPAVTHLLTCDSRVDPACAGSVVVTAAAAGCSPVTLSLGFQALEICANGTDDDGDGAADCADLDCSAGSCSTGALGVCGHGAASCTGGGVPVCTQTHFPSAESCDGLDNDCDGTVDAPLARSCYAGPPSSIDPGTGLPRGACQTGVQGCANGAWEACVGQVLPAAEDCGGGTGNGIDEDCDGVADETCGCIGEPCYGGPAGTEGVGECRSGVRSCAVGTWGACVGQVVPVAEICGNGADEDCDGVADDPTDCAACPGTPLTCYTGPAETAGVGICHAGTMGCEAGVFGACENQLLPGWEFCNAKDDDCDGLVDEGPPPCDMGLACVNGFCVQSGCSPERPCPTGYSCGAGSSCEPALCGDGPCLPGELCAGGVCVDPCDSVTCGAGTFCAGGVCTAGTCYESGCSGGLICRNSLCVPDLCRDVACPIGSFCREGACLPVCALVSCGAGTSCGLDGTCEPDPCQGVVCAPGTLCQAGSCMADPCTGLSCGTELVCRSGACVDDPCADVDCPVGFCYRGQCDSPFP